ncbi:MAG: biosynthetic peptidoglycan transglycosylase [Myxococcota bacterium]
MKVAARLLLFAVGVLAGMAAGTPAMLERLGARVEASLERALDADLTVGAVDWTYDGSLELRLKDVTLRPHDAPEGEPALVSAASVDVVADLRFSLRKVRVERVSVHGAKAQVLRRVGGGDNVRSVVQGLRRLLKPSDAEGADDGEGGGIGRYIERHVPELLADGLELDLDTGLSDAGLARLPAHVTLGGGTLDARNTAVLKEDDNLTAKLHFDTSSVDPGHGLTFEAQVSLRGEVGPVSVTFDRPARIWLGQRALAVGGVSWDGQRVSIEKVALSVPIDAAHADSGDPVDPALTARRVSVSLDTAAVGELMALLRRGGDRHTLIGPILQQLALIEVERPVLVFERRPEGHNFDDLIAARPKSAEDEGVPDASLGPLLDATRTAAARLTNKAKGPDGRGFRGFVVRGLTRLETEAAAVSSSAIAAARRFPFRHLIVREGQLAWRDALSRYEDGFSVAGRLENFDFEAKRDGDMLEFSASFLAPGADREKNRVDGRVQLGSGDLQLHAAIDQLSLQPYSQLFPASVPVDRGAALYDTDATLLWSPASQVARFEGRLGVRGAAFIYPALATDPLTGLDATLVFDAQLDTARKTAVLGKSQLEIGPGRKVRMVLRGDVADYASSPKLTGALRLERARCQDVADAIPRGLLPMLEGLKVQGTIGWQLDFSLDTTDMESLVYHSWPELNQFRVADMGTRLNLDAVRGTFLHRVEDADGTMRDMLVGPGSPDWVSLDAISSFMVRAVMTTEDGSFYRHNGFSPFAIRESIVTNLKKGGFYRGASTISQQLTKNLFLSREKTISRKLQELFITWQLESAMDKDRIMALYLNIIEWGPGIYGIRQASRYYFGKHPTDLTALDAAFLASLIPNPKRYHHQFSRGSVTDGWRTHLRWIMRAMVDRGRLSEEEFASASPYVPVFRDRNAPPTLEGGDTDGGDYEGGGGDDEPEDLSPTGIH